MENQIINRNKNYSKIYIIMSSYSFLTNVIYISINNFVFFMKKEYNIFVTRKKGLLLEE